MTNVIFTFLAHWDDSYKKDSYKKDSYKKSVSELYMTRSRVSYQIRI